MFKLKFLDCISESFSIRPHTDHIQFCAGNIFTNFDPFVYLFMPRVNYVMFKVIRRPLVDGVGTRPAPPPLSDQQPAWWYHMLAKPLHRSKMADSKLTDHTTSDSHQGVMHVLFTVWVLKSLKKDTRLSLIFLRLTFRLSVMSFLIQFSLGSLEELAR